MCAKDKKKVKMPTYDYKCTKCGHNFEFFSQKAGAKFVVNCPKCKSTKTKRKITAPAAVDPNGHLFEREEL